MARWFGVGLVMGFGCEVRLERNWEVGKCFVRPDDYAVVFRSSSTVGWLRSGMEDSGLLEFREELKGGY